MVIPFRSCLCRFQLLAQDGNKFRQQVQQSLRRQVKAINWLAEKGLFFWDYGNSFLLEARRAGADVGVRGSNSESACSSIDFRYPSYVQDIMG